MGSFSWTFGGSETSRSWAASSGGTSTSSGGTSTSSGGTSTAGSSWASSGAGDSGSLSIVSCSGSSCTLTLGGVRARVHVLGTGIFLGDIRNGRATVRVGDRDTSLTQGRTVSVDRLRLRCTAVSSDTVTIEAWLG